MKNQGIIADYEIRNKIVDTKTYAPKTGVGRVRSVLRFRGTEDGETYTSPRLAFAAFGEGPVAPGNEWAASAEDEIQKALDLMNHAWQKGERNGATLNAIAEVYALTRVPERRMPVGR